MDKSQSADTTPLAGWFSRQPRGAMAKMARRTGLSFATIDRAKRGFPVLPDTARLISRATKGEVRMKEIPQVKVGKDRFVDDKDDEPRAVA